MAADEECAEHRNSDGSDPATGGTVATEDTETPCINVLPSHPTITAPTLLRPGEQAKEMSSPAVEDGRGAARTRRSSSKASFDSTTADAGTRGKNKSGGEKRRGSGFGRLVRRRSSQLSAASVGGIGGSQRALFPRGGGDGEGGQGGESQRSAMGDGLKELTNAGGDGDFCGGGSTFRAPHNRKGSVASSTGAGTGTRGSLRSSIVRFAKRMSQSGSETGGGEGGEDSLTNWNLGKGGLGRRRRNSSAGSDEDGETSSAIRSHVSSLKSNRTSGTLATMNFWSKLERKQDIWDTPDYEDDSHLYTFSCRECTGSVCSKLGRDTKRVLLTTFRNPSILLTVLLAFGALAAAGTITVKLLADSYEEALRDDARDRAVETGNWISRNLDEALLPLFTLSQFVQHLDDFKDLPHRIGIRGEEGSAPPENGARNETHRNVTGICDDPRITGQFNEIAASIKKDAKMEGVLVNVQLAPYAVVCQVYPVINTEDFPPDISLDNSKAIGHDLINDENRRFIARATVPAPGVVIAGPLTLIQGDTPKVKEAFIARLAINMPGYEIPLDGTNYECYGFAVIILNWEALKVKIGFDEALTKKGLEYHLTRTDVKEDAKTGERTTKVATIAKSQRAEEVLQGWNEVSTELDTVNNQWVMTLGYEGGFRPAWEKPLLAVVVVIAFLVTVMLMVMLVMKKEMQILLYKMMPPKVIKKLQRGETVVNRYEASTIFFSDVVGFTTLSGSMSPVEVMSMLNDMYTAFDKLVEKYGAYKVDTIGDAYIVIGGGPDNCLGREGAEKVAKFALDAIEVVKDLTAPNGAHVLIRAGIASGPVVAGVVGTSMPKFTLFGDTVNLASRMESTGIKMKIQCNDMTYRLLRDSPNYNFQFDERKDATGDNRGVYVKGKGHTHTWWITGAEVREIPKAPPPGMAKEASNMDLDLGDFDLDDSGGSGGRMMEENVSSDGESAGANPKGEGPLGDGNGGDESPVVEEGHLERQGTARGSNLTSSKPRGENENANKPVEETFEDDEWNTNQLS